uniref:Uncharacterized protein n=1 Tax=Arundo donax TaxID=35708 RepID=A0A0A8Z7J4_ARUDO
MLSKLVDQNFEFMRKYMGLYPDYVTVTYKTFSVPNLFILLTSYQKQISCT